MGVAVKTLILLPIYALMLFIASAVTVNAITFEYMGVCPPALARAEFQKDQLFSLLEGEQGHPPQFFFHAAGHTFPKVYLSRNR